MSLFGTRNVFDVAVLERTNVVTAREAAGVTALIGEAGDAAEAAVVN